ncbi:MAG: flagellar motor protein MotB [Vicinamibacteraceae bacterium]
MPRRRKRAAPQVSHERWLVSYADFITLLFAFFTTMYAISTVDAQKMSKMVASMQVALKGDPSQLPSPVPLPTNGVPQPVMPRLDNLVNLRQQLSARLQRQIQQGNVEISVDARGLVVSIREAGSFASGSAELSDGARRLLAEIAAPLSELPHPVRIEGHTDDTPIATSRFRSNWELSTARATQVIAYLQNDMQLSATRLSAAGYGEFHPRVPNTSAEARAENRRVDLVILNTATSTAEEPIVAVPMPVPAPAPGLAR